MTSRWSKKSLDFKKFAHIGFILLILFFALIAFDFILSNRALAPILISLAIASGVSGAIVFFTGIIMGVISLKSDVKDLVSGREMISDEEFIASFFDGSDIPKELIIGIRHLIAMKFKHLWGVNFWPGDRIVEDLHLDELEPFKLRRLADEILEKFGSPDQEVDSITSGTIKDFYLLVKRRSDRTNLPSNFASHNSRYTSRTPPLHEFLHLLLHHLPHTHALRLGQCLQSLVLCLSYMKRDNEPSISIRILAPRVDMTS